MPITCEHTLTPLSRAAFGKLTYAVYAEVLAIRQELGRFFDERIYKQALARRCPHVTLEVPIWVSHGSFKKVYYLDALLAGGGVLEFKAAEAVVARHLTQLLHYLMLAELRHGMLVNVRPEQVSKRYVNNVLSHADRRNFSTQRVEWNSALSGAEGFETLLLELLHDWGTSLDLTLYEEALTHFFGGESQVIRPAAVVLDAAELGSQALRFAAPGTAFKLTAFEHEEPQQQFLAHCQKLVTHTQVEGLLWANIARHCVTFRCLGTELTERKGQEKGL
ncbi:MAG: GxxExxY protein [Limisphaerales bacterium]